jgi:hypothetical protein
MLNIAEFSDRTAGCPGMEHPHTPELIMDNDIAQEHTEWWHVLHVTPS